MTFRILSLDGGGTWALLEAMALADIYPGLTGHQILSGFDLIVANSGGSIVLGGLMIDVPPATILSYFQNQTNRLGIFHKKPWIEEALSALPIFPRYDMAQKRVGLSAVFGPPGDTPLDQWSVEGPSGSPVGALIVSFDYDRMRAEFLRSYAVPSTGAVAESTPLVDAVHASTNAPVTFFDGPALVPPRRYWDGAMGGFNNPLMAAVVDAIALGAQPEEIECLSIGTGQTRLVPADLVPAGGTTAPSLVAPAASPGPVADAGRAAGCITDDPPDAATFTAHVVLRNTPGELGRVVRMSPLVQPVRDGSSGWIYPTALPQPLFDPLIKLQMDAVEQPDVDLIGQLGDAWINQGSPNHPIRMGDDLSCALGDETYAAAKARWLALIGG